MRGELFASGLALLAGVGFALYGVASPPAPAPETVAARVGEQVITRAEVEEARRALASDRRDGAREEDEARVLERLIDEALLVEYWIAEGLALRDRRLRAEIVRAVLDAELPPAEDPGDAALARFVAENAAYFARVRGDAATQRAVALREWRRRQGEAALRAFVTRLRARYPVVLTP